MEEENEEAVEEAEAEAEVVSKMMEMIDGIGKERKKLNRNSLKLNTLVV